MTMPALEAPTAPAEPASTRARPLVRGAVLGTAMAWVATTVVYVVGNTGGTVRVVTGWSPEGADLTYVEVVTTVAVSIALGAALLGAMQRRYVNAFALWTLVAVSVAVLSAVPLWRLDVDYRSKLALDGHASPHGSVRDCRPGARAARSGARDESDFALGSRRADFGDQRRWR